MPAVPIKVSLPNEAVEKGAGEPSAGRIGLAEVGVGVERPRSGRSRPVGEELEVVGGGRHGELLGRSGETSELECSELHVAL